MSGSASSTQTYWSVKDAKGTKLQQTVQQMETTVETAAETTVSWFAKAVRLIKRNNSGLLHIALCSSPVCITITAAFRYDPFP